MKFKSLLAVGCLAVASGLRAQMPAMGPQPVSDPVQVSASAVYGFDMKKTGYSVEGGKFIAPGHFVGLEATYFHLKDTDYFANLPIYSKEHETTVLALYRFNWTVPQVPQLSLYVGGGAGVGIVRLRTDYNGLNIHLSDRSNSFAAEGQAGVEWMFNRSWGVKLGYRYFRIYDVELFKQKSDIHDNLAEGGITYKF